MRSWKRSLSSFPIAFPTNILECPYYYSIIPSHSSCTIVNINLDTFVTKITLSSIWNAPAAPALLVKLKPLPQENFLNHSSPNQLPVQLPAQLFKPWCQHKSAEDRSSWVFLRHSTCDMAPTKFILYAPHSSSSVSSQWRQTPPSSIHLGQKTWPSVSPPFLSTTIPCISKFCPFHLPNHSHSHPFPSSLPCSKLPFGALDSCSYLFVISLPLTWGPSNSFCTQQSKPYSTNLKLHILQWLPISSRITYKLL